MKPLHCQKWLTSVLDNSSCVAYPHTNTSGNIIKDDLRLQWTNEHTLFSKRVDTSVVCEGWVENSSSHVFFQEPGGANACTPCKLVRDTSGRRRASSSTAILYTLSNSDHVFLIPWSPSGYTPVVPECPDRAVLFTNHNMTACQSTRGH